MTVTLPPDYKPSTKEKFMNPMQQEYFRQKLNIWRSELLDEANETRNHLQQTSNLEPDIADRASAETERSLELRTRDRAQFGRSAPKLRALRDGSVLPNPPTPKTGIRITFRTVWDFRTEAAASPADKADCAQRSQALQNGPPAVGR